MGKVVCPAIVCVNLTCLSLGMKTLQPTPVSWLPKFSKHSLPPSVSVLAANNSSMHTRKCSAILSLWQMLVNLLNCITLVLIHCDFHTHGNREGHYPSTNSFIHHSTHSPIHNVIHPSIKHPPTHTSIYPSIHPPTIHPPEYMLTLPLGRHNKQSLHLPQSS